MNIEEFPAEDSAVPSEPPVVEPFSPEEREAQRSAFEAAQDPVIREMSSAEATALTAELEDDRRRKAGIGAHGLTETEQKAVAEAGYVSRLTPAPTDRLLSQLERELASRPGDTRTVAEIYDENLSNIADKLAPPRKRRHTKG